MPGHVVVTGGAGYIGSILCPRLLREGYSVTILDDLYFGGSSLLPSLAYPGATFRRGNICDPRAVEEVMQGAEYVIHLAAVVGDPACDRDPDRTRMVNLDAACLVASTAKKLGVWRFVAVSTCSNYGAGNASDWMNEESPLCPLTLYAKTKVEMEQAVLGMSGGGFEPVILRLSTVFGLSPRMRFDLLVNALTRDAVMSGRVTMDTPEVWRPYVHTTDVAEAMLLVLASQGIAGQVFNIGSDDQNYQRKEVVKMVQRCVPTTVLSAVTTLVDLRNYRVSFHKAATVLGFKPRITVEQGIQEIASALEQGVILNPSATGYYN